MGAVLSVNVNRGKPAVFNRCSAPKTSAYGGMVANRPVSSSRSSAVIFALGRGDLLEDRAADFGEGDIDIGVRSSA
jgi:hypothetical protein